MVYYSNDIRDGICTGPKRLHDKMFDIEFRIEILQQQFNSFADFGEISTKCLHAKARFLHETLRNFLDWYINELETSETHLAKECSKLYVFLAYQETSSGHDKMWYRDVQDEFCNVRSLIRDNKSITNVIFNSLECFFRYSVSVPILFAQIKEHLIETDVHNDSVKIAHSLLASMVKLFSTFFMKLIKTCERVVKAEHIHLFLQKQSHHLQEHFPDVSTDDFIMTTIDTEAPPNKVQATEVAVQCTLPESSEPKARSKIAKKLQKHEARKEASNEYIKARSHLISIDNLMHQFKNKSKSQILAIHSHMKTRLASINFDKKLNKLKTPLQEIPITDPNDATGVGYAPLTTIEGMIKEYQNINLTKKLPKVSQMDRDKTSRQKVNLLANVLKTCLNVVQGAKDSFLSTEASGTCPQDSKSSKSTDDLKTTSKSATNLKPDHFASKKKKKAKKKTDPPLTRQKKE